MSSSPVGTNKLSEATNQFMLDVYKEIIKNESGNIIFSPLAAEVILSLLYCGTKEDSARELAAALHLSGSKEEIQHDTKTLLEREGYRVFQLANAAYFRQDLTLKKPFLKVAKEHFSVETKSVDFAKSDKAAEAINRFVANRTNNMIKDVVSSSCFSAATCLVLVNALRFKADWAMGFSEKFTKKASFCAPDKVIQVDSLYQYRKHFGYCTLKNPNARFLELPFEGDDEVSMVVVLPTEKNGLSNLETQINEIATIKLPFNSTCLNVALPKFKFEYQVDFKKVLTQLGVSKIFDPSQADLSDIAGDKGDAVVNEVVQKAYIDVNEGGLEAVARNPVRTRIRSDCTVKYFIVNQPFIFLLKHRETTILAGRIVEPTY